MADLTRQFPDPPAREKIRNAAHIRRLSLLEARGEAHTPNLGGGGFPQIVCVRRGYAAEAARLAREAAEAGFIVKP
jgi:hypothetical protein